MKRICIVCSSKLPQPPVLGGAVSQLIQYWVEENEKQHSFDFTCVSVFNDEAIKASKSFKNTKFIYIKIKRIRALVDSIIRKFLTLVKRTNKIYSWGYLFRTFGFRKGVKKVLLKNDFDCVVFENSIPVALCMKSKRLQKKYKGKYYYHTHCVPRNWFNSGKVLESANSVICVSKYIEDQTIKRFSEYKIKTTVLYNCIDTSIFKPLPKEVVGKSRKDFGISTNDFIVGFIGRLSKDKGIIELIEAIKQIKDPSIKLMIAGSTFYGSNVKDKFMKHLNVVSSSIKDKIIFTGYIKNDKTPEFYCSADVVCLPPVWEEPGAVTNIEAAACGRPIISTFSGGNKEYIGEGRAILLSKDDKEKLSCDISINIQHLKDNPIIRENIAREAFEWAKKQDKHKFFDAFKEVLGL